MITFFRARSVILYEKNVDAKELVNVRAEKLMKNTVVGVLSQVVGSLTGFIVQFVFIRFMIREYLGARGLFSSILDFLSLAELGLGLVLVYSMYIPIAEKDERKLTALTQFYRKAYYLIAGMIFCVGLCLMPFLDFFIENMDAVPHARLIYFLYLVSSASSYLWVYKQSILNADQRIYIVHLYSLIFSVIQCALQVAVLVTTHNFFLFLLIQIVAVVTKNILTSRRAGKLYPFLNTREKILLTKKEKKGIYKNVFAMFNHRVGAVVLGSTDNLLISKFIGIVYCGFYSNFKLIIALLNSMIGQFFNAMLSSVGSMHASESKETMYGTFKTLHFLSFWLHTFCTIGFIELANPVLRVVLNMMGVTGVEDYLFGFPTVLMIGLNFYVVGIRKVPLTFKEAMGLLWNDRYKPLIEAALNVVVSILCIRRMGIAGIFFGTIFSMATTSLWVEPLVLFRHGFERSWGEFWRSSLLYYSFTGGLIALTHLVCGQVNLTGWGDILVKLVICLLVPNAVIALCFCRTRNFRNLFAILRSVLTGQRSRTQKAAAE